ncbi:helix-turn-helix transcriptional regulator [Streptomyces sp. NPDC004528]|uniref:helix-turn-helix domain-containing protein n=1 Tax=Streptomyces sp. NPDC004528 TaxID=3154550 RepID=UPI0033B10CD2
MTDTAFAPAGRTARPGRPELAIAGSDPVLAFIAQRLRELRNAAGFTYRRLEKITGFSATQLKRAGRGERTTVDVVVAYAQGCNATAEELRTLDHLHTTLAGSMRPAPGTAAAPTPAASRGPAPAPEQVATAAHLTYAIDRAWQHADRPSLRTIETRSGKLIPRSTASRILKGATLPDGPRCFHALLTALYVEVDELVAWFGAWIRVFTPELTDTGQDRLAEQLGGEARIAFHLAATRHHAERGESEVRARLASVPPRIRQQILADADAQIDVLLHNGRKTPHLTTLRGKRDNPTRPLRSIA